MAPEELSPFSEMQPAMWGKTLEGTMRDKGGRGINTPFSLPAGLILSKPEPSCWWWWLLNALSKTVHFYACLIFTTSLLVLPGITSPQNYLHPYCDSYI